MCIHTFKAIKKLFTHLFYTPFVIIISPKTDVICQSHQITLLIDYLMLTL